MDDDADPLLRLLEEAISGEALAMQGAGWSGDLDAMREDAMREPDATAWPTDATAGS